MEQSEQVHISAVINELTEQRNINGNRAATLAGALATAQAEIEKLKARVTELEAKPADAPKEGNRRPQGRLEQQQKVV